MKIKLRTKILALAIISTLVACVVYVFIVGGTYPLNIRNRMADYQENSNDKIVKIEYEIDGDSISPENQSLTDGIAHVDIVGKKSGKSSMIVNYITEKNQHNEQLYIFYVTSFGTVIRIDDLNFNGYKTVVIMLTLLMFFIEFLMVFSFADSLIKSKFTYSLIACGGVGLFFMNMLAMLVYDIAFDGVSSFSYFLNLFIIGAVPLLTLTAPVIALLAIAVSVSNIVLMFKEGFRVYNALGIILSGLWAAAIGYLFFFSNFSGSKTEVMINSAINSTIILVCAYFECMLISTMLCAFIASRHKPNHDRDYIVILGCAIRGDGTLTPLLRDRVKSALSFERKQFEKTGKHASFVPSGGQGSDEVISESEAMKRYLVEQGVPEKQIIKEDKSVNTLQNLKFSKEKIEENTDGKREYKAAFATTGYHIFRGYILAKKNGFKAEGIASKTKWYFFPNAFLREFAGLLYDKKLFHLFVIVFLSLFYFALQYLNYLV